MRKIAGKRLMMIVGYWISLSMQFFLLLTFLAAYFRPTKDLLITINEYGEMHIELVILIFVMLFSVGGFMFMWKENMESFK